MLDKTVASLEEAVKDIADGSVVVLGGFAGAGIPTELIQALLRQGAKDLTLVSNNAGNGPLGMSELIVAGRVRKLVSTYSRSVDPANPNAEAFAEAYRAGRIELECVPQGTLAERLRAAGSGMGPFFTPTSYGTALAEGKETRIIDGAGYVLEQPLRADYALIKAHQADRWGNLNYRYAGRNFSPVMCMAAEVTIAQVDEIVPLGGIAPDGVMTPGIFVQRVVRVVRKEGVN
jgi:3-oxoadipate CoA-transferase, alpha subunit